MLPRIGYLLPTREQIMEGRADAAPLLVLAARAEALGYASVWGGDSVLARPRHDPTCRRRRAGATRRAGHRGAAGASSGDARSGVGGAVHLGRWHRPRRAEHPRRVRRLRRAVRAARRMLEGLRLCRALWRGEPVDWDGRWPVASGVLAPVPHRAGGPPIWIGGNTPASLERVGRLFDGWFPNAPNPAAFAAQWAEVQGIARAAGRDPARLSGAMYLTLTVDDDADRAVARMDAFLEGYYGAPPAVLRRRQAVYSGPADGVAAWLAAYARAGATDLVLHFAGDHEWNLEALAKVRESLGW